MVTDISWYKYFCQWFLFNIWHSQNKKNLIFFNMNLPIQHILYQLTTYIYWSRHSNCPFIYLDIKFLSMMFYCLLLGTLVLLSQWKKYGSQTHQNKFRHLHVWCWKVLSPTHVPKSVFQTSIYWFWKVGQSKNLSAHFGIENLICHKIQFFPHPPKCYF